jgi:hypothetical protein
MNIMIFQIKPIHFWRAMTPFLFLANVSFAADGATTPANTTIPPNPFGPKPDTSASSPSVQPPSANTPLSSAAPTASDNNFVPALRAILLRRFDKNGDGKLDATELAEARKLLSGGLDTRPVTPAEAAYAANGPLFGLRALIMQRFDHQGTGQLDAAEMAEINTLLFGADDLASLQQSILHHFDKKGDGQLDATERAAAKAWLEQVIADLDKDNPTAAKPVPDMK